MKKIEYTSDIGMAGYGALALAIIEQACIDYIKAIKKKDDIDLSRLEHFFRSQWFTFLTSLDGEYLMKLLRENVNEETD